MFSYRYIIGDTLENLFTRYAWRFLLLTLGIFFLLDLILSFLGEFEDLSSSYSIDRVLFFLFYTSLDALLDIFPLSAIVSTIICMGFISDSGELIAARVSGKKLSWIIYALLKPVIIGIIFMLISWQYFIPGLQEKANTYKFEPQKLSSEYKEKWVFKNDRFSKIIIDQGEAKELKIYDLNENGNVDKIISSKNFSIDEKSWIIKKANDYKNKARVPDLIWNDPPKVTWKYSERSLKHMSLTDNFQYWQSINEVADQNKVGYEFWKKLLEPISLICLIIFALAISLRSIGRNKSVDRFVLGILIAFGFNLLIKIFGNISLIFGFSAFWGIILSSLALLFFGIKIIKRV